MKISYRTHPVLEKLKSKKIGDYKVFERDILKVTSLHKEFESIWELHTKNKTHNVYIVSQPFVDSFELAADKLYKSDNIWNDVEDCNVCYIFPTNQPVILNIKNDIQNKVIYAQSFTFHNGNIITSVININIMYPNIGTPKWNTEGWMSQNVNNIQYHILNCVLMTLFIKYAQVETKYLPPHQRIKEINCKYTNDTDLGITTLDSTWFTNLVKSDEFKVRGHFRLQPKKKDGEWTKELIWIKDFTKSGYTRKAGILNQPNHPNAS